MIGKTSRRTFFKSSLSLAVFGVASHLPLRSKRSVGRNIFELGTKAHAMNNPDYASDILDNELKIEYMGMSCFLITAGNGTRIITDPFHADSQILHPELRKEPADIVLGEWSVPY